MTVKELREELSKFPDNYDVVTKKTEFCGNVGMIFNAYESTYGFIGADVPCVILTDGLPDEKTGA